MSKRIFFICCLALLSTFGLGYQVVPVAAGQEAVGRFENLLGWWGGKGKLFFRDGQREDVKCRATYRWEQDAAKLLQSVRCASASGKVEVKAEIWEVGDNLKGVWSETTYEFSGDLEGKFQPKGFRVKVKGNKVQANMTVIADGDRQIVEIQFHDNALLGLTMIFERGRSG